MPDDSYGVAAASTSPLPPPASARTRLPLSQTQWIIVSMIIGALVGYLFPYGPDSGGLHATDLQVVSSVFLRMIKSLIAPLLFATLVVGIAGQGNDLKRLGKLALRSILYFEVATSLALAVGLLVVNVVKPGIGVNLAAAAVDTNLELAHSLSFSSVLEHTVPHSIFDAAARNDSLQITFFAIIFAIALSQTRGQTRSLVLSFCESLSEVMFKLVNIIMKFAPLGIGAAIAVTVARSGLGVLENLGVLVLCLYGGVILFAIVVLLPIGIFFKVPIRQFLQATREPSVIAFTTASSEAALPLALRNIERMGVPRRIASFVLPAGYAFNMDGTTLYLAIASVFVAQAAGIDMSLSQQVLMMITLMLTSKGLAGVPRASLVILSGTLAQFGLPLQGVAIILGVDALMDMARTSLNVVGNCLAAVLLARWDHSLEPPPASQ
ncbi:MAG: sodium:dicarboxylate symporter [Gammaproteobacteria bacterium]|nr:sodium:dicarboxylate symporter [Gammaproteobacteria bacterium]